MAKSINSVAITARLTQDAELRFTNSGTPVTKLSVANNYTTKENGEWVEKPNFFSVRLWGKQGEVLNQYLTKGTRVAISGELRYEEWEKDNQKRSKVLIEADNIELLGSKQSSQNQGGYGSHQQPAQQQFNDYQSSNPPHNQGGAGNFEDDIPF